MFGIICSLYLIFNRRALHIEVQNIIRILKTISALTNLLDQCQVHPYSKKYNWTKPMLPRGNQKIISDFTLFYCARFFKKWLIVPYLNYEFQPITKILLTYQWYKIYNSIKNSMLDE